MKRANINDVAHYAGVSKSTVSHVINHTRFVEDATRQRVLDAIEKTGYRPSSAARSLTTKRTGTVGVIISDASNYFFGEVLRGVEDILKPMGYGLVVCNTDETLEREGEYLEYLLRQQVDGIIAAATSQRWEVLSQADVLQTPIVFLDRTFEGLEGPFVGVENHRGAYLGTQHLVQAGYREIGVLAGFQRLSTMRERLSGFMEAMKDCGLPVLPEWVAESPLNIESARNVAADLLRKSKRPRALLISNNLLSLGTLQAVRDLGLRCPEDIALVGFDDHPWAAVTNPPLTVVRQPSRSVGQKAAEILSKMINGNPPAETSFLFECGLILRDSCCLVPHTIHQK